MRRLGKILGGFLMKRGIFFLPEFLLFGIRLEFLDIFDDNISELEVAGNCTAYMN